MNSQTDDYRKGRLLCYTYLIAISYCILYSGIYVLMSYHFGALSLVTLGVACVIGLTYFKRSGNILVAGNYFAFIAYIGMGALIMSNGTGSGLLWWTPAAISGFLYANRKSGIIWTVISGLTISVYFAGKALGYEYPMLYEEKFYLSNEYTTALGLFIYVIVIILIYEHEKNALVSRLQKSFGEINAQNEEIRQQQEEILAINESLEGKNSELALLSSSLSDENTKMVDSLRYARTIQTAVFPSAKKLTETFDSYFAFYRPKDIVSGDFYWIEAEQSSGYQLIALGDCTGHGVPGAFMSIIGTSILNDLVLKKGLYHPAEILTQVHERIKEALNQDSGNNKDGIELAICAIKPAEDGFELLYAGAKHPLYLFQPEATSLTRIKGTKRAIGGYQGKSIRPFEEHSVFVEKGTLLYLLSDGYADQNNASNLKFGSNRLIELLESIHYLPLQEQKHQLSAALDDFQQDVAQRDDITIFGIKL